MHAVGGVHLQAFAVWGVGVGHHFIDTSGAEAGAGVVVFHHAAAGADVGVGHVQVHGLVFVMCGGCVIDALQAVARGQGALAVVAFGGFVLAKFVQAAPVGFVF